MVAKVFAMILFITCVYSNSYQRWQCDPPSTTDISSVFEKQMKNVFDVIGYKEWVLKNRTHISCFARGLSFVPADLDSDVEILDLNRNSISVIRRGAFDRYQSIVALLLCNNCVKVFIYADTAPFCPGYFIIEEGTLQVLKNLKYLDISGNRMKVLPMDLPISLIVLYASLTSMRAVEERFLNYLHLLEVAQFSSNCIMADVKHYCVGNFSIHGKPFPSTNLTYLDLSFNNWTRIPKQLLTKSMTAFRIRGNPIKSVKEDDFVGVPKLTFLILSWVSQYCPITLQINDAAFRPLTELERLDLSGNMIETLPKDFLKYNTKLKHLSLNFNCLHSAATDPHFLPRLNRLERLELAGNTMCADVTDISKPSVPKLRLGTSFRRFPNLNSLHLGLQEHDTWIDTYLAFGTRYIEVDGSSLSVLEELPNFKKLVLGGCGIQILSTSAWSRLNLALIDLRINQIGEEPELKDRLSRHKRNVPFNYAEELFKIIKEEIRSSFAIKEIHTNHDEQNLLSLQSNAISDLTSYDFGYSPMVTHLDLSKNNINYVYNDAFRCLKRLRILDLRQNPIRSIHEEALSGLHMSWIRINNTAYEHKFSLDFLKLIESDVDLQFGALYKAVYMLIDRLMAKNASFPNVRKIDLSNNPIPIFYISRNIALFSLFPNLVEMNLDSSSFRFPLGSNLFHGVPKVEKLLLRRNGFQIFPYVAVQTLRNLTYLDLSYNLIEYLDKNHSDSMPRLKVLIISHNLIARIKVGVLDDHKLIHIDLSFNRIRDVGPDIMNRDTLSRLEYLDLRGNMITCRCSLTDNFGWLVRSNGLLGRSMPGFLPYCPDVLFDFYGGCVACEGPTLTAAESMFSYSTSYTCEIEFVFILTSSFVTFIVLFTSCGLICKCKFWKNWILGLLSSDSQLKEEFFEENVNNESERLFAYDGFIFYDRNDDSIADWVDYRLIPEMETGNPPFRLSVIGREDYCGATQVKQLLLRMEASRKTIVILTGKFCRTPRCKYVLSVLEDWLYTTGEDRCVIILLKDDPVHGSLLRRRHNLAPYSILQMTSSHNEDRLFWNSFRTALIIRHKI